MFFELWRSKNLVIVANTPNMLALEANHVSAEKAEDKSDVSGKLDKLDESLQAASTGSTASTAVPAKAGASQQKRRILRENLEESRQYMMSYDKNEKRLVVNERCDAFEHNIWDKDAAPKAEFSLRPRS